MDDLTSRAATSLGALLAATFCGQAMLPAINPEFVSQFIAHGGHWEGVPFLSIFALGLSPFVLAFVTVEFAALRVPRWRPLRTGGPSGRARLRTAAVRLGLTFALLQSVGLHLFYAQLSRGWGQVFLAEFAPVTIALLVGGTVSLHLLTGLVDRNGLGNGYAVVLLGLSLAPTLPLLSELWDLVEQKRLGPLEILVLMLGVGGVAWGVARVLRGRPPGGLARPTSGLVPLTFAALLAIPFVSGLVFNPFALPDMSHALAHPYASLSLNFVLTAVFTGGFSVLFHRPQRVGAVWAALTAKEPAERPEIQARMALRVRQLLPSAIAWSLVLMTLAWLPSRLAANFLWMPRNLPGTASLLLGVAIVLDLFEEARRFRTGPWVGVWPVHRVYEVEPALAALSAAGIPAWARGGHARAMLQFFGPYFPIDLMVPPTRAAEAQALLERARLHDTSS